MMNHLKSFGTVTRLQIGQAMPFAREQSSAIQKYAVDQVEVTTLGFVGDEQADQFFHGGQLQAIHQMPVKVYALIRQAFPEKMIYEGMLGENIIVADMCEDDVCIGDKLMIGNVLLQITRPRRPCWKIDALLETRGVAKLLQDSACVGWYYQVLQVGEMKQGDSCVLVEREYPFATLTRLWQIYNDKNFKDRTEIEQWLQIIALERSFKEVLAKRLV